MAAFDLFLVTLGGVFVASASALADGWALDNLLLVLPPVGFGVLVVHAIARCWRQRTHVVCWHHEPTQPLEHTWEQVSQSLGL